MPRTGRVVERAGSRLFLISIAPIFLCMADKQSAGIGAGVGVAVGAAIGQARGEDPDE